MNQNNNEEETQSNVNNNNDNNSNTIVNINMKEIITKKWNGIDEMEKYLLSMIDKYPGNKEINMLLTTLNKFKVLNMKLDQQDKNLKLRKLIALKERNTYLQKLRFIEDIGSVQDWQDEEGVLDEIKKNLFD